MKRSYTMTARAEAAEQTRQRILESVVALTGERLLTDVSLDDVARRADVSVQTVLRRFGSRAGLLEAAGDHVRAEIVAERRTPVGDVAAAVATIVDHYESRGDGALLMLAQESTDELMARLADRGRAVHREWVSEVFAPYLAERSPADAEALLDLLVVATDLCTWKLLRRDRGLSRRQTERRIHLLLSALLGTAESENAR